jgi:hypothetical protein
MSLNRGGTGEPERGDGWLIDPDGYRLVRTPHGWKKEHHWVWFQHTGQWCPPGYVLHHIDEDKLNNDISNLQLMTNSDHRRLHMLGRVTTIPRGSSGQFIPAE